MREEKLKCTQKDFTKRKVGITWKNKSCKIKKSIYEKKYIHVLQSI